MNAVQETVIITKADVIEAIYSSPEGRLSIVDLREVILKKYNLLEKFDGNRPLNVDVDYRFSWVIRSMIADGWLAFNENGALFVVASWHQLKDEYPPAKERGFRLVPWKPTT